jgi:hypothetical protein
LAQAIIVSLKEKASPRVTELAPDVLTWIAATVEEAASPAGGPGS